MSDPGQNPPPEGSGSQPPPEGTSKQPPPPPSGQPGPGQPPQPGQGSHGTAPPPPPPQGGWQQGGWQAGRQPRGEQPAYAPRGARPGIGQPADLTSRFVARLLDVILLGFARGVLLMLLMVGVLARQNATSSLTGWSWSTGTAWAANAVASLVTAALSITYFTIMENKRGQTLGKMVMRLETRGPHGGRPTFEQALKRNAFTAIPAIGAIPFVGGLSWLLEIAAVVTIAVTINSDRVNRHGWHDDFAGGTTVIRIG